MIKLGVLLSQAHPRTFDDLAVAADALGYESVWLGEHMVLPAVLTGSLPGDDGHSPIAPTAPVLGCTEVLCFLAGHTRRVRLGTFVYLLGLRHPFVSARAFTTLDVLSGGRAEVGVGAGWIRSEWEAIGIDFDRRGRCLDEALAVCSRLWTQPEVSHRGEFFSFPPVLFEPKPLQDPIPVSIGGESPRALRRAARSAQGWLGMEHTPATAAKQVGALRKLETDVGRTMPPVAVTVVGELSARQPPSAWEDSGVDRLIVHPWRRSREAVDAITRLADKWIS